MSAQPRDPTEDEVRAAWRALAGDNWGAYEDAKAGWLHFSIARARARRLANGGRVDPEPPVHTPATPPTPAAPPRSWGTVRVPHTEPIVDRKRLAANDHDD